MQRRVSQSPVIAGVWLAMVAGAALALVSAGTARADAPAAAHPQLDWGSLRWPLVAIGIATVPVAGLLIAISATLRDRATLERVFGATPTGIDPIGASVRDIAPVVRRARRKALWRSVSILVTATLISVLVWYLRTLLKAGVIIDLLMFPLLFALLTVAYMWWERRRSDGLPFEKQPVLPAVIGTVGALVVVLMASYAINAAVAIAVLSTFFYVHAFSSPPVIPIIAMIFIAYVFVRWIPKILRFTSTPLDLSRRLAAPTVSETLAADHRREVLFLRSFADDDLAIRTHRSMRHSPVEFATTLPFERFEVVLTWTAWRIGPVCAIGKPKTGHALQPLGAAREFYADDTWQHAAHDRIASAALVIFVVGRTEGLQWEIRNARAQGALERCLFVVPPVALDESRERLTKLADMVGVESASLPPVIGNGRYVIGVHFSSNFAPTLICSDGRDDLAYQSMIESVGAELARGAGEIVARNDGSGREPSHTADRVGSILSEVSWDYEAVLPRPTDQPTVGQGTRYIIRSAARRLTGGGPGAGVF